MAKKLETADSIVKLMLSLTVIFSYFTNLIRGDWALVILMLALLILVLFVARFIVTMFLID